MHPLYLNPPEQHYRWLRIEHADGVTRDHPYMWFSDAELAMMTDEEIAAAKASREAYIWKWAQKLWEQDSSRQVARVVDEWTGTAGDRGLNHG